MTTNLPLSKWGTAAAVLAISLVLAGCAGSATTSAPKTNAVVTFAEQPGATPNYIIPLQSGAYLNTDTLPQFSQMMYLPLYWFGNNGEPVLNRGLSLADPPIFSQHNTVVTIQLKHWVWSNGQPITARDVIFWMNLLSAVTDPSIPSIGTTTAPGPGWGASAPGAFPQNVISYSQTGTYSLKFTLNASYNPTWFTYNELSQIYPMPTRAWDKLTAAGAVGHYDASAEARILAPASVGLPAHSYVPSDPGTATSGALGVAQFLNSESENLATYDSNPLWQVVDGPFRLSAFTSSGFVKLVPNRSYSGLPKPRIAAFEELPFTSDSAEVNALRDGQLTIGYLPPQDLKQRSALEHSQNYAYSPWYDFGIVFAQYNFTNPTQGPIFKQLYFRRAFQSLVNQPQYIRQFMAGIGTINNGPVPTYPVKNPDESPLEAQGQVYPYDPGKARSLLAANGWAVHPGGTTVCARPGTGVGECGKGIAAGQPLNVNALYASGYVSLTNSFEAMQSTMKSVAGITLALKSAPAFQVISIITAGCTTSTPCSTWGLADWATGYTYYPDYFPTGGTLFASGAAVNNGDYRNSLNNQNISATHTASNSTAEIAALFRYEDYLAKQLPVVWMPNGPYQLTMYKKNLHGLVPQGIYDELYPQFYSVS